ncbi:MAG: hypothetical protein JJT82_06565 [Legionellaceae bacterium]|nr:hypothetical protein [Legionellaceae bacterium]
MSNDISAKNTKNEILEAYHEALQKLKESKKASKQDVKGSDEKKTTIATATNQTSDEIVKSIAELKLSLVRSLEDIEEKSLSSYKKLTTLQQAIDLQSQELDELHEIKVNADSLAALLYAQQEKTALFEKNMKEREQLFEQELTQKRATWKKEQEEFEVARKDYEAQTKKSRQREEEEYVYQRDLVRQKERDQYTLEKEALEKELTMKRSALEQEFAERAEKIAAQEQEFHVLKEKAEKFPAQLQQAIEDTRHSVTEHLTFKFDYESKLAQKEVEGERKLYQQTITALEAKVAHLEAQVANLADKTNQANLQVQDIAVKAIEGASRQRFAPAYSDKTLDSMKQ